jgi:glycosyltransferase involved in cell wall biosynthesis
MNYVQVDTPLISVVMPVYNSEAYLAEAIESILAQTYPQFEFIIIDDCSTDSSAEIIRNHALKDTRIRPLYLSHRGAGGAANAGIAAAKGELIARMDADDIALPERFATQIAWMRRTGVDICGSCIKMFGAENRLMWFPESHEAISVEMLFRCALMQPTVMLRADIAKMHPYNESLYFEDYELWTRLAPNYRMGNVPQVLLKYRTHPQQRHIQKATDVCNELRYYCRTYFRTLFPDASIEDESVIASIACNEPLKSLAELELFGTLLKRLAYVNDSFFQDRIAQRWWVACKNAANLGLGSYHLYRHMTPVSGTRWERRLFLLVACALRLKPSSKIISAFRRIKIRAYKLQCK